MESRNVFISSTTDDLSEYRGEAVRAINKLNEEFKGKFQLVEIHMDNQGQSGERESPRDASERWVSDSQWVILIVAFHYGYVPPGNDRSVTEYEYRYAREKCDPPKPCFVFIAGEDSDTPRYQHKRDAPEREKDLGRWWRPPDPGNFVALAEAERTELLRKMEQVARFRAYLRDNKTYELFSDIDDFSSKLERSLKNRIELELRPFDSPDGAIRGLILAQRLRILACFSAIRLLATLKRAHDRLHRIRQYGIVRWQKEVLALWRAGPMDGEVKETFQEVWVSVREDIAALRVISDSLSEGELTSTAEKLKKVLAFDLPTPRVVGGMVPSDFERHLNAFARIVQMVFSAVEDSMSGQRSSLRREYNGLKDELGNALRFRGLSDSQHKAFDERLKVIEHRIDELEHVLETHRRWQKIHDQLEILDKTRKEDFRPEFRTFLSMYRSDFRELLAIAEREPASISPNLLQTKGEVVTALLEKTEADGWDEGQAEGMCAQLREAFDLLFFDVDTRTREFVTQSEQRVKSYEESLQALEGQLRSRRTQTNG